ncbi:MAG: omptin family outer membrane protease [Nitrospira sp.]|nr:omptin family outer membrane protease [Nitrospira sp.]
MLQSEPGMAPSKGPLRSSNWPDSPALTSIHATRELRGVALVATGETMWSHDASGINPVLGNPTSKLTYKDTDTHIVDLAATWHLTRRWFVQGHGGFSVDFDRGRLIDDDYLTGQYLFSRTSSPVTGTGTWYVNGNVGYRTLEFPHGRGHMDVLGGFRYWRTEHEATGFDRLVCDAIVIPCVPQSSAARAITNTSHWITPIHVGINTDYRLTTRFSIGLKVLVSPVSIVYNEDVHHLRADLQQDPSFSMWGIGVGGSAEPMVKFMLTRQLAVTAGYRVWWNRTYTGTWETHPVGSGSQSAPLNEFQTIRHGATLGLTASF